jgi:hypothetical protein
MEFIVVVLLLYVWLRPTVHPDQRQHEVADFVPQAAELSRGDFGT